jgi:small subunit ribosomal protein S1
LAERHVEIPEQIVQVGDEIFVKVIDIDLERRRISLSLKQAKEKTLAWCYYLCKTWAIRVPI